MSKIKHSRKRSYTVTANKVVRDGELSWKARGIFNYLWSMPEDWEFYMNEVVKHSKDGMTTLKSGIKELEDAGYLKRIPAHSDGGKFTGMDWLLSETQEFRQSSEPSDGNTVSQETRQTVNQPLLNTNTTKDLITLSTKDTKRNKKESSDDLSGQTSLTDRFEKLWKLYPKKQGKQVAFRAYKRAVKKGTEDKDIELGIANYKKYIQIKKISSQYIKQGSTWFNQGCWEDEYDYGNQPQQKKRQYLF